MINVISAIKKFNTKKRVGRDTAQPVYNSVALSPQRSTCQGLHSVFTLNSYQLNIPASRSCDVVSFILWPDHRKIQSCLFSIERGSVVFYPQNWPWLLDSLTKPQDSFVPQSSSERIDFAFISFLLNEEWWFLRTLNLLDNADINNYWGQQRVLCFVSHRPWFKENLVVLKLKWGSDLA